MVLKTSRLPTWVVLLDQVLRGQPTCHKSSVRASDFFWIAHAAAECIVANLSGRKDVSIIIIDIIEIDVRHFWLF